MFKIRTFILFVFLICSFILKSQNIKKIDNKKAKNNKTMILSSGVVLTMGIGYSILENVWWNEAPVDFHFDNGPDLRYAKNLDKAGHFLGGLLASEAMCSALLWNGVKKEKALVYGAFFGTGTQLLIEIKDGYAPYWGFSLYDLVSGSLGSLWPIAKENIKFCNLLDFKFSYFKYSNIYWDLEKQRMNFPSKYSWQDDYPNQTYWISLDLGELMSEKKWPDFLRIALGIGLDESQKILNGKKIGGLNEFYISLDYDLKKIVSKWNNPYAKKIIRWLNHFKFPAPTIRLGPEFKFFPFFI